MEVGEDKPSFCLPEGEKIGSIYKNRNSQLVFYIKTQLVFLMTKNQSLVLPSNQWGLAWMYVTNLKSSSLKGDSISLIGSWGSWWQENKKRFRLSAGYRWDRSGKKDYWKEPEWGPLPNIPPQKVVQEQRDATGRIALTMNPKNLFSQSLQLCVRGQLYTCPQSVHLQWPHCGMRP